MKNKEISSILVVYILIDHSNDNYYIGLMADLYTRVHSHSICCLYFGILALTNGNFFGG